MFRLNNIRKFHSSVAIFVIATALSACSPFSILKTEFEPKEIAVYELNLKRNLYYANAESMVKNSSVNSQLRSFGGEGFIANHKLSKDYKKISPSKTLSFTGRIYKYESSILERALGGAKDFHCFYEINFHSKKFAMPSILAPQIYDYHCEEND